MKSCLRLLLTLFLCICYTTNASSKTSFQDFAKPKPNKPASASLKKNKTKDKTAIFVKPGTPEYDEANKQRLTVEEMGMQRAWLYSAVLPGLGQFYNEQPIRAAVVYGVFIGLGFGAYYWHNEYIKYSREGDRNIESNLAKEYKKLRDIFMIFGVLWYVANVFDAYVGASLKTYDISDDIGLKVKPIVTTTPRNSTAVGLSLEFNLAK